MKKLKILILTLSTLCLIFSLGFLIRYYTETIRAREEVRELIKVIEETPIKSHFNMIPAVKDEREILPQYSELYNRNTDIIGWIRIPGTSLDYPVMFTPDDGEFYLHRNFDKEYEYSGLPFIDKRCSINPRSTNLIIYGHNMKSNALFSSLTKYESKEYFDQHPIIIFDTIYEEGEYEIIAVIKSQVFKQSDEVFKFYQFINASNEDEFQEYIGNINEISLYDTGKDSRYGDQLITLTTCAYHTENGRLAVIAKKVIETKNRINITYDLNLTLCD